MKKPHPRLYQRKTSLKTQEPQNSKWSVILIFLAVLLILASIIGPPGTPSLWRWLYATPSPIASTKSTSSTLSTIAPFSSAENWVVCGEAPCVVLEVLGEENCKGDWRVVQDSQTRLSFKGMNVCFANCLSGPELLVEDCNIPDKDDDGDVDLLDCATVQRCGPFP